VVAEPWTVLLAAGRVAVTLAGSARASTRRCRFAGGDRACRLRGSRICFRSLALGYDARAHERGEAGWIDVGSFGGQERRRASAELYAR
jgi:hypothetical protein